MRAVVVIFFLAALAPLAQAQKLPPPSVRRARACVAATVNKHLTERQYKSFMEVCLASKRPPAELFETSRTIERRCNTMANARQLGGQARIEFMQACRRKAE